MAKAKLSLIITLLLLSVSVAWGAAKDEEYSQAQEALESGSKDIAFMNFLHIARGDAASAHRQEALFACAEYYFSVSDYIDAFNGFKKFLEEYPGSEMKPFALLCLYKIATVWGNDDLARRLETHIKNLQRVILLFKDMKEYKFRSPLHRDYRLAHYIDRLEFYLDGKLQAQIFF